MTVTKESSTTDILKAMDVAKEICDLVRLWNLIAESKYERPLCEIEFAKEHFDDIMQKRFEEHKRWFEQNIGQLHF